MSTTPPSSSLIDGDDPLVRCFDATAHGMFVLLCRLTDGDFERVGLLLTNVYVSIDALHVDRHEFEVSELEWMAIRLAVESNGADWSSQNLSTLDRALIHFGGRHDEQIAPAFEVLRSADRWLDEITLGRVRAAVVARRLQPVGRPSLHDGTSPPATDASAMAPVGCERAEGHSGRPPVERHSRRLLVFSGVAVAVALAAGAMWVAPNDANDANLDANNGRAGSLSLDRSATTSTPASAAGSTPAVIPPSASVSTTTSPPTTINRYRGPRLHVSPGFLIDGPIDGFEPAALWESSADDQSNGIEYRTTWYQLWIEPEATRTTGRWIAIATSTFEQSALDLRGGRVRIAGDGWTGLVNRESDGVVNLSIDVTNGDGYSVHTKSFGLSDEELFTIATTMVTDPSTPLPTVDIGAGFVSLVPMRPGDEGSAVLDGLAVAESGPTGCCGVDGLERQPADVRTAQYSGPRDHGFATTITIDTNDGIDEGALSRLITSGSADPDFPTNASHTVVVNSRLVYLSADQSSPSDEATTHVASWVEDGQRVTVTAALSIADLIGSVQRVRPATDDEWLQFNQDAFDRSLVVPRFVDPMGVGRVGLGQIDLGDNSWVRVAVNIDAAAANIEIRAGQGSVSGYGYDWSYRSDQPVTEYSSSRLTILLIAVPTSAVEASVRVTVAGRDPTVVPLTAVVGAGVSAAFDVFTQLPPYTVELIGADGVLLETLAG